MYRITCDGFPLLDTRDEDYVLENARVKTEVNTVGEGSFKIYSDHPNFDKLIPLKSVFEVRDENGILFRGRMTEDTADFHNGKDVDLEGAMAYFNDSAVSPYVFPDVWLKENGYPVDGNYHISGNLVELYLGWFISQHNSQVEKFQRFKLGTVTVREKNNYFTRASSDYPNTWQEISDKLLNSFGGFLCIRYEEDGNYIDYLSEFTEVNEQGITYGENMLDISQNTDATATYSAIIPLGAEISESSGEEGVAQRLTIEEDDNAFWVVGDDHIIKKGKALYSFKAVEAYGWRCAPREETTWDDVTKAETLETRGIEFLKGNSTKIPKTIKITAVDLHYTDEQIRAFRIYKKIPVYSPVHGTNEDFDLTYIDYDLLNPQNTKIIVGKTPLTITKQQTSEQSSLKKSLTSYEENLNAELEEYSSKIKNLTGTVTTIEEGLNNIELSVTEFVRSEIQLESNKIHMEVSDFQNDVDAQLELALFKDANGNLASKIHIDANKLTIDTDNFTLKGDGSVTASNIQIKGGSLEFGLGLENEAYTSLSNGILQLGNGTYYSSLNYHGVYVYTKQKGQVHLGHNEDGFMLECSSDEAFLISATDGGGALAGNWSSSSPISSSSDRNIKNSIESLPEKYSKVFDNLRPVIFKYNDGNSGRFHTGFIAQEVAEAVEHAGLSLTDFAAVCAPENSTWGIRYDELIALNTSEIQKLKATIKQLEERIVSS